jgi:uncharacterized protein (DUF433 family)
MKIEDSIKSATGLYTVTEAATYARMHPRTLSTWLYGGGGVSPLRQTAIPKEEGRFLTFIEFVEALAIRNLRVNYDISFQKIRQAVNEAKNQYGIEYPFANKEHKTFLIGRELHIVLAGEQNPVQLTGKEKRQESMKACLEQFMHDLEWDHNDMASAYVAYRYPGRNRNIFIKMRPSLYFGAPIVEGTGHTAETLWRAALAEGSEARVAEFYEVDVESVIAACRYCEEIKQAA